MKKNAGLVIHREIGNSMEWSLNEDGYAYKTLGPLYETLFRAPAPLEKIKEVIKENLPKNMVLEAKLFGSMARGDYGGSSNVCGGLNGWGWAIRESPLQMNESWT